MIEKNKRKPLHIYYCGSQVCEPGHAFGPAVRPHYLIHFILTGKGRYTVAGKTYQLDGGDAFLIHPGEMTFYQADWIEPWTYTWVAFDGTEAEDLLFQCGFLNGKPVYLQEPSEAIADLSRRLSSRFAASDYRQLELRGLLYLIFSHMAREQPAVRSRIQREYVSRACDYMEHNFGYDIKVEEIARFVGIDRTYLYKVFMREWGKSPQQFLMEKRLNEARNLLLHSALSVTEIACSCGFHDAPSFCRHFKLSEKCTPLQYRRGRKFT